MYDIDGTRFDKYLSRDNNFIYIPSPTETDLIVTCLGTLYYCGLYKGICVALHENTRGDGVGCKERERKGGCMSYEISKLGAVQYRLPIKQQCTDNQ